MNASLDLVSTWQNRDCSNYIWCDNYFFSAFSRGLLGESLMLTNFICLTLAELLMCFCMSVPLEIRTFPGEGQSWGVDGRWGRAWGMSQLTPADPLPLWTSFYLIYHAKMAQMSSQWFLGTAFLFSLASERLQEETRGWGRRRLDLHIISVCTVLACHRLATSVIKGSTSCQGALLMQLYSLGSSNSAFLLQFRSRGTSSLKD